MWALSSDFSVSEFLRNYWQQKPLLVRNAIVDFNDPLTPEELAGLACEETVESRLVQEKHAPQPWQVRHGPFQEADFVNLPADYWTLLVQDVEKHIPDLAALLELFRFIPDWRVDDLMISYAAPNGSVGPHWDEYDVFLLQGQGKRRWQINTDAVSESNFLEDVELRILKEFTVQQEWVLNTGDLLYLPPRVMHYGVALEPCLTYSIGFRAPGHQEIMESFVDFLHERLPIAGRYGDPGLAKADNPGEISAAALAQIRGIILNNLQNWQNAENDLVAHWFGRFITDPKLNFIVEPLSEPLTLVELQQHLEAGYLLERNPSSRFVYIKSSRQDTLLFVDGQEFALHSADTWVADLLCRHKALIWDDLAILFQASNQHLQILLLNLVNAGYLVIYEDD